MFLRAHRPNGSVLSLTARSEATVDPAAAKRRESSPPAAWRVRGAAVGALVLVLSLSLTALSPATARAASCSRWVVANVVAIDQPLMFNRLGAQNVNGMIFALERDVVESSSGGVSSYRLRPDKRPRPMVLRVAEGECLRVTLKNRLTPTANQGNPPHAALDVNDQVADRTVGFHAHGLQYVNGPGKDDGGFVGRNASSLAPLGGTAVYELFAEKEGAYLVTSPGSPFGGEEHQGNGGVGLFAVVNVEPKGSRFYRSQVTEEELRLATTGHTTLGQPILNYGATYPAAPPWNGEGKAGRPILAMMQGSEIVHSDLNALIVEPNADGSFPASTYKLESKGLRNPALPTRLQPFREFTVAFHDEMPAAQAFPMFYAQQGTAGPNPFAHTLFGVRDAFMINYGSGGIGSEIIANRLGVGPMHDCLSCAYEEFFLTSFTVGDPAMIVDVPANVGLETLEPGQPPDPGTTGPKASFAYYPDDPSNVHHAYIGDHVKFRNVHHGAENHVFHLHNHQWLFNPNDDDSNYIDAQGIGPGSGYTYEIAFQGAGNRNRSAGDAIFHCHFYPHFAQGMWAHFRVHDVLETGTVLDAAAPRGAGKPASGARALPDGEIVAGTPIPAVVPLPTRPLPPMPGDVEVVPNPRKVRVSDLHADATLQGTDVAVGSVAQVNDRTLNPGYPFWVAGIEQIVGQRPTTPPLDMLTEADAASLGDLDPGDPTLPGYDPTSLGSLFGGRKDELVAGAGGFDGGLPRHALEGYAAGGAALSTVSILDFSKRIEEARPVYYPEAGTDLERVAMAFHARPGGHPTFRLNLDGTPPPAAPNATFAVNGRPPMPSAPYHDPCIDDTGEPIRRNTAARFWGSALPAPGTDSTFEFPQLPQFGHANPRVYKGANIQIDAVLNKVGYHYPQQRIISLWGDVDATIAKTRPPEPFVIRFNTLDCAKYLHTNLVPDAFELDDYQVRTPTDIIGQHIHLPKWDLTTTDGSANGWNYEDGTLSPGAVRERIHAINEYNTKNAADAVATLPRPDGTGGGLTELAPRMNPAADYPKRFAAADWLGARTTIQRWFFDPVVNTSHVDRGLGNIFTHDHYGPSTHQQIGLYASVLVEPAGSTWAHGESGVALHTRSDGGPTSWQAIITSTTNTKDSFREFWFQASDFQHAYLAGTYIGAGADGRPNGVKPSTDSFRSAIMVSAREGASPVLPDLTIASATCPSGIVRPCPEAISVSDPGMFVVNYRNEPVGLRVYDPNKIGPDGKRGMQADGLAGDLAFALQSRGDRKLASLNRASGTAPYPPLTADLAGGDPFTPMMRAYAGDKVRVRVQIGGHEEELQTSIHGLKWLQAGSGFGSAKNSGWRNAQANGISEQFTFEIPLAPFVNARGTSADYAYSASQSQDGWWSGVWGLIRTYNAPRADLARVPGSPLVPIHVSNARDFDGVCPRRATVRSYDVTAVLANDVLARPFGVAVTPDDAAVGGLQSAVMHVGAPLDPDGGTLVYNPRATALPGGRAGPLHDPTAMLIVHTADLEPKDPAHTGCIKYDSLGRPSVDPKLATCPIRLEAGVPTEPIALRAAAGECVEVTYRNRLPGDTAETGCQSRVADGVETTRCGNGVFDDNPDLGSLLGLQGIVLRDRESPEGVTFFNNNLIRPSSHVGLHTQLVAYDVTRADGTNVGRNPQMTVSPGGLTKVRWYAGDVSSDPATAPNARSVRLVATPVEFGGVSLSPADKIKQGQKALLGSLVIERANSSWDADPGRPSAASVGTRARNGTLNTAYRSFALTFQKHTSPRYANGAPVENLLGEGDAGTLDDGQDSGQMAINNRTEPLWFRFGLTPQALPGFGHGGAGDLPNVHLAYSNELLGANVLDPATDPVTPVFTAKAGQEVRMHLVNPHGSYRGTTFTLNGHVWQRDPYVCPGSADLELAGKCTSAQLGSTALGVNPLGFAVGAQESVSPATHFNVFLPKAGGAFAMPGDYLFRDVSALGNASGLWGILRVEP